MRPRISTPWPATLDSRHEELVVSRSDIARVFPHVIWHAEKPLLRTAAAPLFLLSELVRKSGIKAVLTGEGADEMLGGYDLFREAKIRAFWARQPESRCVLASSIDFILIWPARPGMHGEWRSSSGSRVFQNLRSPAFLTPLAGGRPRC